jgi:hypothetical protein
MVANDPGSIAPIPIPPPPERYDRQNEAAFRNAVERLLKKLLNIPSRVEATTIVEETVTNITIVGQAVRRSTVTLTTPAMAPASFEEGTFNLGGDTDLVKIVSDQPGWLRLYRTAADRTADAGRVVTDDPTTPIVAEFVFTDPSFLEIDVAPVPHTVLPGTSTDGLIYWRFDLTGAAPAGVIADDFSTAGSGDLTAYTPPGGSGYSSWIATAVGSNITITTGAVHGGVSSGGARQASIQPDYADRDFVGIMKVTRGAASLYNAWVGFSVMMPDGTPTNDISIQAGIFGGAFPAGATLTPQIVENQTPGDGVVVLASGSPLSISPGADYYLKLTVSADGLTLTLEGNTTGISGPWTNLCSTVLTGTLPAYYLDGSHTAVGILNNTADLTGAEWLIKYLNYAPAPASVVTHIGMTRVLIEGTTP